MGKKVYRLNILILVFIIIPILIGMTACTNSAVTKTSTATSGVPITTTISGSATTLTKTVTATGQSSSEPLDFVSAVAKVLPSVVIIEGLQQGSQIAGSGWILNSNGIIVTNAHVVYNSKNINITLADGRVFPATSVQNDLTNDLAVLKIGANNLQTVTIGDSSSLQMGQRVAAVGNSLDLGIRVTSGVVSRLNGTSSYALDNQHTVTITGAIETDTIINPGNSGGVLININGEIVGITNAGLSGTTDVAGFAYAININSAMPLINNLATKL